MEVVGYYTEADIGAGVRDSTKFIDFLSAKTDDEQWEGSDLLYLIINDIVRAIIYFKSCGQLIPYNFFF